MHKGSKKRNLCIRGLGLELLHPKIGIFLAEVKDRKIFTQSSRSGEQRTQKLKSHLVRTQSLNVLPLNPGVGQSIAIHATLIAEDFFLAHFYPIQAIHLHFSQNLSRFFPALAVANTGSCVGPQNEIGHPARCRFPC